MGPESPKPPETPKSKPVSKAGTVEQSPSKAVPARTHSTSTLTSSLNIPVKGAVPIEKPTHGDGKAQPKEGPSESKDSQKAAAANGGSGMRNPRKAKGDAIIAIAKRAQSPGEQVDVFADDASLVEDPLTASLEMLDCPDTLDMQSVKTRPPRDIHTLRRNRPFDLEECPTFYPTQEEFVDALAYIQSIRDIGAQYGVCKIVPPEGWEMPFVTDTSSFRFKTRVQRLNQIEAAARAKLNFLDQLYQFHSQQGNSRMTLPTISNKPLDLWLLRREVQALGGYEMVNRKRIWGEVGRRLGYTGFPSLSTTLKTTYTRVILPFEHYAERVKNSTILSVSAQKNASPHLKTHQVISSPTKTDSKVNESPAKTTAGPDAPSSPLSHLSELSASSSDEESEGRTLRNSKKDATPRAKAENGVSETGDGKKHGRTGEICEVCHKSNRGTEMLLCDGCDSGFHIFCLDPPLHHIPRGEWYCHTCIFGTGEDFGFDEGEEHSLSSFQARDRAFRGLWLKKHPPTSMPDPKQDRVTSVDGISYTEADVENEFWRLVHSPEETFEIEYGADVHSTTHGSAMPTLETHPQNPYAKDSWNLNNMPIAQESLLRYIKSEISGMTVPWTYVGMIFSTFCWHNEDHYTYSINYMHWGETKTWYGIPGSDAEKFEEAMRQEAPDLFKAQPDLLFQLVTLMSPSRLAKAGVKVTVCDQRAGEFVVTFPKAYHAGFNHGFNFNEAVNFALPDWLDFDRQCVERYQKHKKLPVFSHDELLITITQYSQSIKTALWLSQSLNEMHAREMAHRENIRKRVPNIETIVDHNDRPEEQYQCSECNVFTYLSQVSCRCRKTVTCIEHESGSCKCPSSSKTLNLRFSDAELHDLCRKMEEKAMTPVAWNQKYMKTLKESKIPLLRNLKSLLAEGEKIGSGIDEFQLSILRKCVNKANEWVDAANGILARKQHKKRFKRLKSSVRTEPVEEMLERPEKTIEDVYRLLSETDHLGVDCPEFAALRAALMHAEDLDIRARTAHEQFADTTESLAVCETILADGASVNIYLENLFILEKKVLQHKLLHDIADIDDSAITLDEVRALLTRARACELPRDNPQLALLQQRQDAGDSWELKARRVLEQPFKTIEELAEFDSAEGAIPVDPTILDKLRILRQKATEFERQANAWLHPEDGAALPKVQEVLRMVNRAEQQFSISSVRELRRTAEFAADLESRCEMVLRGKARQGEEIPTFDVIRGWGIYAKEHLNKFQLPNFDKLEEQLEAHERWLERLPWYCAEHKDAHGKAVYDDVMASTNPKDDFAPQDEYFTCICSDPVRPPPNGENSDAVQCDHCFARFHGDCARKGGSCPFCDHHHWNGSLHKERAYHYCYMPSILVGAPDITKKCSKTYRQLDEIVARIDRLSQHIGSFLAHASQAGNQRPELLPQVRHYMRKLYRIKFAVSPNPDVSYGLDLAGLHRILANQPLVVKQKKRRRPKFLFGQDLDQDWGDGTRCICRGRTGYLLGYNSVQCESCNRLYHGACVFFEAKRPSLAPPRFQCPLCCLRKNKAYPNADVRVKYAEDRDPNLFVDVRACLDRFSKDLIKIRLQPPRVNTVFVDLIRFTPGSPEGGLSGENGSHHDGSNGSFSQLRGHLSPETPPVPPWPIGHFYNGVKPPPPPPPRGHKRTTSEAAGTSLDERSPKRHAGSSKVKHHDDSSVNGSSRLGRKDKEATNGDSPRKSGSHDSSPPQPSSPVHANGNGVESSSTKRVKLWVKQP